jgi:4'-phosphopantetheinyl transferase
MSRVETAQHLAAPALDPTRPLQILRLDPRLTGSVVSIAWLTALGPLDRTRVEATHFTSAELAAGPDRRFVRRRAEWLAGRLAAKHAVRAHQRRRGAVPASFGDVVVQPITVGMRAGKPLVASAEISISHSGGLAVAVCGPVPVGVDVERGRALSPVLVDLLSTGVDLDMPLPLRWACKEAVLKNLGFGLRVDSREVRLSRWGADGRFAWDAGPELARQAGAVHAPLGFGGWARQLGEYALAITWQ